MVKIRKIGDQNMRYNEKSNLTYLEECKEIGIIGIGGNENAQST